MDIFKITKSKIRRAIFELYFLHPEKKYYLRELERILVMPVQNIRRELMNLEKSGLFKKEQSGKQVYYFLNTKSPLYGEIKNIVSKTIGIEWYLKKLLAGMEGIKCAFIFGSFAHGTEDVLSDVDLMIIGKIDEDELIKKISAFEKKINREVNYHIFSEIEFLEKKNSKDAFICGVLSKPVIFLIGE